MITESEARQRLLAAVKVGPVAAVELLQATGRYAAEDILATVALPGFDNSMMDGYAVRAADTCGTNVLPVIGEQPAGLKRNLALANGQAIRIFTGAPMPAGADAVIMQEDVDLQAGGIVCREPVAAGENVRRSGADLCAGQVILRRGERISPGRIGVLASQGIGRAPVHLPPRVLVLSTGDELIAPGHPLLPGQVYNSNGFMLQALLSELGVSAVTTVHCGDVLETTVALLDRHLSAQDMIVLSGGVSVGDHDQIKPALKRLGITPELWRVSVKPGKPFLFAQARSCFVFGLPGNPVSSFVTFHLFVRPAILRWLGASDVDPPCLRVAVGTAVANDSDRPHYIRGVLRNDRFTPQGLQQSHALFALSQANALLRLEPGARLLPGDTADVFLIG
jgi:molybdopterin molybdotransferase